MFGCYAVTDASTTETPAADVTAATAAWWVFRGTPEGNGQRRPVDTAW